MPVNLFFSKFAPLSRYTQERPSEDQQGFIKGILHAGASDESAWVSGTTSAWESIRFARGGGPFPNDSGYIIVFSSTDSLRPAIANDFNINELEILIPVGIAEDDLHKIIHIKEGLIENWSIKENFQRAEEQWRQMGGVNRRNTLQK